MGSFTSILLIFTGILIGYVLSSVIILKMLYDDRYYTGWGIGWEEGWRYGEKKAHESD